MRFTPYEPRPVRLLEVWASHGVRLKVYGIASGRALPRPELVAAAKTWAEGVLARPTGQTSYGVGFLGVHDGRTENQVFLDQWINENELRHQFVVSPSRDPAALAAAPEDHNSVCVWDLAVQAFEREAWLKHVLRNPRGPDLEAYLRDAMDAAV